MLVNIQIHWLTSFGQVKPSYQGHSHHSGASRTHTLCMCVIRKIMAVYKWSTWCLKTCHIPTVGSLYWNLLCVCLLVCLCAYVASTTWYYAVDVALLKPLGSFHSVYFTMLMLIYWSSSVNVPMLIYRGWSWRPEVLFHSNYGYCK